MSDLIVEDSNFDSKDDPLIEPSGLRGTELLKKSQITDSKDDPLIEISGLRGIELVKKSQIKEFDTLVVRCTVCRKQINHLDYHKVKRHRRLNVIVCKECYDFYGTEEFTRDEAGNYNYCTWCGNGGTLFLCDFCPNVFCLNCVRRNFGRAEVAAMQRDGWKCYVCDPNKIKAKVAYCDLILDYSKSLDKKEKKVEPEQLKDKELISETWVLEAFTKTENSCKTLQKKLDKLKHVEVSRSKSLKHIIKKMEEVVGKHKIELSNVMKTLSQQYLSFIKLKQEEEKLQTKDTNVNNDHSSNSNKSNKVPPVISIPSDSDDNIKKVNHEVVDLDSTLENIHEKDLHSEETNNINADESDIKDNNITMGKEEVSVNGIDDVKEKAESAVEDDGQMTAKMNLLNDSSDEDFKLSDFESGSKRPGKNESRSHNITVTAEVHSSELQNDSDLEKTLKSSSQKSKSKINITTVKRSLETHMKNCVVKESSLSSLSSESSKSEDESNLPSMVKTQRKKPHSKPLKKKPVEIDYVNDPKLRLQTNVVVERCDDMMEGKSSIKVPTVLLADELEKALENAMKDDEKPKKSKSKKSVPSVKKQGAAPKARKDVHESSSSITFSSEDEDEVEEVKEQKEVKPKFIKNNNSEEEAKRNILESDDSSSDSSDSDAATKKKSKKNVSTKVNSDSSDDFQPRKKKKFDKLLNKRILSDNDSSKQTKKGSSDRRKKRKLATSDDDFKSKEEKTSESDITTTESDSEKKPKSKKRRRIKKPAASSSENNSGSGEDKKDKTETPKKGRKDIQKIISKKDLKLETKEAQQAERERRKRIEEKQKLYNVITDTSKDGNFVVTKKLVLEVDPTSKEEVVQIHPDLIEKLKPHQVNGVKFMWECTIESLEALQKSPGSGCILAHCMGLGKTLQVITFLHTCLTNKEVSKHIKTAMVICPYNTVLNWSRELDLWLGELDSEAILVHEMTLAKDNYMRLDMLKFWKKDGGILIISYDLFRRLAGNKITKLKKSQRDKVHECLLDPGPDIVVCDEGHVLKNETSAVSKACNQLKTERRIVLTGTPLQNNLKEYHVMLSFVKPHLLGTTKEFRNRFVNPIMNGQYEDSNEYDVRRMKKRIHILHKLLEGCVQRCDYFALTKFLPPKYEFVISVKLSDIQIKMYQWYLDNMSKAKGEEKIRGGTLFQDYNTLRNLCTHPYIIHTSFIRALKRRRDKEDKEEEEEDDYEDSFIDDDSSPEKSGGSDTDEVIRKYKTRAKKKEEGSDKEEEIEDKKEEEEKHWYHEFISDADAHKLELSGKMVLLMNILKECESIGDKVIVFSQSLLTLDIIENILEHMDEKENEELVKNVTENGTENETEGEKKTISDSPNYSWVQGLDYFRMDGQTSAEYRKTFIDKFNNPNYPRARLFLVSTRAGGLGTNLVGANRVVILDASWNPSHDVQAIFRVYRFGQKKPVYIYRLLAKGTMEEKIYDRQVTKLSLSIRVVDEQQIDRHFNSAELSELYTFEPDSLSNRPTPMVPNDRLLAEMLIKYKELIVSYHEHDSLLQNETEEDLTEAERKAAWNEFENEREGRNLNEISIDEEIAQYCKEPDFDQADYDTPVLPTAKFIVDDLLNRTRIKCGGKTVEFMRRTLLNSIKQIRSHFLEMHVKVLRMKQEFLAKGSVPSTVNKYVEELNTVITHLKQHYEKVAQLVADDDRKAAAQYQAAYAHAQAQAQPNMAGLPRGFQTRFPFMNQNVPGLQQYQYLANNYQKYVARFPNAFAGTTLPQARYTNQQIPNVYMRPPATPPPVITIPSENQAKPTVTTAPTPSSVVIEEIE